MFWRRPALDRLETPFFRLARHTSARDGINSWVLFGCAHAMAIHPFPIRNRLRLAVLWRKAADRLLSESFHHGYSLENRNVIVQRLGYQYQEKL